MKGVKAVEAEAAVYGRGTVLKTNNNQPMKVGHLANFFDDSSRLFHSPPLSFLGQIRSCSEFKDKLYQGASGEWYLPYPAPAHHSPAHHDGARHDGGS